MEGKHRGRRIIKLLFAFGVSLLIFYQLNTLSFPVYDNESVGERLEPFGEILSSNVLKQQIVLNDNLCVDRLDICMATYARRNTSHVIFEIYSNNTCVYSTTVLASKINDNKMYSLKDLRLNYRMGNDVYLIIKSPDGVSRNAITAWVRRDAQNGKLYSYNSQTKESAQVDGEVSMIVYKKINVLEFLKGKYSERAFGISLLLIFILFILTLLFLNHLLNLKSSGNMSRPD